MTADPLRGSKQKVPAGRFALMLLMLASVSKEASQWGAEEEFDPR